MKRTVEAIEDIPGLKIMSLDPKEQKMVIHLTTKDAAHYIVKELGNTKAE